MLRNLPQVTKNLLILNVLVYLISLILISQNIPFGLNLGAHYVNSILFEPYQIITHMFMHSLGSPMHILFNMLLLVMFGAHLEQVWGSKRYFIFYMACGFGAFALYNSIGVWEIISLRKELLAEGIDLDTFHNQIRDHYESGVYYTYPGSEALTRYEFLNGSTIVGASGAIFGLLSGFAMLFPNTQLMLLFPPIPIKAKYLIGAYLLFEIYSSIFSSNDQIAHLAHVGGAIVGIILILIWRKRDRKHFW